MEVYKRERSSFFYFDYTVGGRRRRVSTKRTDKAEAEEIAARWLLEARNREQHGDLPEVTLREALFDHYLPAKIKAASYRALKTYCEYLCGDRKGIKGLGGGGDLVLHRMTTPMIRTYRNQRSAQGMSDQSIDHEVKCVSAAYRIVAEGYRVRQGIKFPMARPKGRPRPLSADEVEALLADLNPTRPLKMRGGGVTQIAPLARTAKQRVDNYDLVVMLLDTGCRFGEIAHLTWQMVDRDDFAWVQIWREKVDNEGRLSTTERMKAVLKRRLAERGNSPYVFRGWAELGDEEPRTSTAAIRRAMNRVGINSPEKVKRFGRRTVRSCRDTFATTVVRKVGLLGVQKLLGHTSPQMTMKYSAWAEDAVSADAVAFLDGLHGK